MKVPNKKYFNNIDMYKCAYGKYLIEVKNNIRKNIEDYHHLLEIEGPLKIEKKVSRLEGIDRLRELIRIRDNHTCQVCHKKWVYFERRLDVHHIDIIHGKNYKYDKEHPDRLITLCHKCHLELHRLGKSTLKCLYSRPYLTTFPFLL